MILDSEVEVANTREKPRSLGESFKELRREVGGDEEFRLASMQSLKSFINQFKEEIARYEARQRESNRASVRARGQ